MQYPLPELLHEDMRNKGIDIPLSLELLSIVNAAEDKKPALSKAGRYARVPSIDGETVIDLRRAEAGRATVYSCLKEDAVARLDALGIDLPETVHASIGTNGSCIANFSPGDLMTIGTQLFDRTAYGVLNGGSATSYADSKKNLEFGGEAYAALTPWFSKLAPLCRDIPKGMAPAYVNPDGTPGASFLELKMRARLLMAQSHGKKRFTLKPLTHSTEKNEGFLPLFQMTSSMNDAILSAYYSDISKGSFLSTISTQAGIHPSRWIGGIQPLICAYTHSCEGKPRRIFDRAFGNLNSAIPLPGGHGQCFRILAETFRSLKSKGIRYACLGNVDNIGYLPDLLEIAILAISGKPAAFEFAARSPMDVKGGILVEKDSGILTVADIGPAISIEDVLELERKGNTILFNCASGIFDLDYLIPNLDQIARSLPVRISDQDKMAGKYSQAEQITWEITELLPSFIGFVIEKRTRFLAAKLLLDTLLTSGIGLDSNKIPQPLLATAKDLHAGLQRLLEDRYSLSLTKGRWVPRETLADQGSRNSR
jgi:hypothetical protein